MAVICNVVVQSPSGSLSLDPSLAETVGQEWRELYLNNEPNIESGSAYFSQAFAEAAGVTSDLELHDPRSAGLKLQSISFLLSRALEQYEAAVKFESWTGLSEYHERRLREAGLDLEGVRRVLHEAQDKGFLSGGEDRLESLALTFDREGYSALTRLYLDRVRHLRDLTTAASGDLATGGDLVAWQELGWKLIARFSQAAEIGQAMAILNTFTFRLQNSVDSKP